jgi:hypothetical protein
MIARTTDEISAAHTRLRLDCKADEKSIDKSYLTYADAFSLALAQKGTVAHNVWPGSRQTVERRLLFVMKNR